MFGFFIMLILETLAIKDVVYMIITAVVALWLWKSGIPQQLFKSSNDLLTLRTTERDDALRQRDLWKDKYETLEEEFRILRRELTQRIEITAEDRDNLYSLKKLLKGMNE